MHGCTDAWGGLGGRAQLVPQMLLARQKLMPCDMSTYAGSTVGKGVRRPGDTSAASSDLPRAKAAGSSRPTRNLCNGRGAACPGAEGDKHVV